MVQVFCRCDRRSAISQEAALHYQKAEYPLDYTKTASSQTANPQDDGADSLADRLNKATNETQEAAPRSLSR